MKSRLRLLVPLALAIALTSLPAAASEPLPARGPGSDGDAWMDRLRQVSAVSNDPFYGVAMALARSDGQPVPVAFPGEQEEGYSLEPFGDVDGDGRADLLKESWGQESRIAAVSAADPSVELWSFSVPDNAYWYRLGDVTGDGVPDLAVYTSLGSDTVGQGQGLPVGSVNVYRSTREATVGVVSGTTGSVVFERAVPRDTVSGWLYTSTPVSFTYGQAWTYKHTSLAAIGGTLALITETYTSAIVWADAGPVGDAVYTEDVDLEIEFLSPAGQTAGRVSLVDPSRSVYALAISDANGDGSPDVVAAHSLQVPMAGPAAMPLMQTDVVALSGKDGSELWRDRRLPGIGFAGFVLPLGDVDGSAGDEFGYLELAVSPVGTFQGVYVVYAGADGDQLAGHEEPNGYAAAIPFGDVDGDGKPELLFIQVGEDSVDLSATKVDLAPLWTFGISIESEPLNLGMDDDMPAGADDWTGDGAPDLAIAFYDEGDFGEFSRVALYGGRDGAEVWNRDFGRVLRAIPLADATGDAGSDLVVVTAEGDADQLDEGDYGNSTIRMTLHAGATGKSAWSQVLMEPARLAGRGQHDFWISVEDAGDTDGDDASDILAHVGQFRFFVIMISPGGEVGAVGGGGNESQEMDQWYLVSGRTGSVAWADPEIVNASLEAMPGEEPPPELLAIDDEGGLVPGPGVLGAALAVVAGLLVLRRRHA